MWICLLIFLILAPAILLYTTGYRINTALNLYKTGGLYISSPFTGSKIFLNNYEQKETNILQSGVFMENLKPAKYSVLVTKDGYWPWQKKLEVKEQFVTEAMAMLIPKNPEGKIILHENYSPLEFSKYDEILTSLKNLKKLTAISTTTIERFTNRDRERLWWNVKEEKLRIEWLADESSLPYFFCDDLSCKTELFILNPKTLIRNADFYPGRKDIIIASYDNAVYAIEIDSRGQRVIQPIYKGKEPIFTTYKNEKAIYVFDDNNLIEINLD